MPSVCMYFQVHQPNRLKAYSYFQIGKDHSYFDDSLNREIVQKVAAKCYLPANKLLLELIERHEGRFKVAFSLTGVVIEQLEQYAPEALESFVALARTGCVEFLSETYYHSMAALVDIDEFSAQISKHKKLVQSLFGQTPRVFRNTELVYNDAIGELIEAAGYRAVLAEGADDILRWRSPNHVYRRPGGTLRLLLRNYRLSDDIAFRFSNRDWAEYPLGAKKFARWVHSEERAETVNLFMDYETFGEHQWAATGIFEFLSQVPAQILSKEGWSFLTPSETVDRYEAAEEISFERTVSWADLDRDVSAWNGNHMQRRALSQIHELNQLALGRNNPMTVEMWRRLQSSDHFYYMSTKGFADGEVHAYFNPYRSPYEAFINYMNVVTDFKESVLASKGLLRTTA